MTEPMSGKRRRCRAQVWRKDTYRIVRGFGFRMHYNRGQCLRAATDSDLCAQHAKMIGSVPRYEHAEEFMEE